MPGAPSNAWCEGSGEAPDPAELRDLLSGLYRKTGRVSELAPLLAENALRAATRARSGLRTRGRGAFLWPCGNPSAPWTSCRAQWRWIPDRRSSVCLRMP